MKFFSSFDLGSLVLGAFLGAVFSTWHSYFVKRPLLAPSGGGGGGAGKGLRESYAIIQNKRGLLGLRIGETSILGFNIHRRTEYGLPIERETAKDCTARIYEKTSGEYIKNLWWDNDKEISKSISIESNKSSKLMVFARDSEDNNSYFIWDYDPKLNSISYPDNIDKLRGTREFIIKISHSSNKRPIEIEAKITETFNGKLRYTIGAISGSFF